MAKAIAQYTPHSFFAYTSVPFYKITNGIYDAFHSVVLSISRHRTRQQLMSIPSDIREDIGLSISEIDRVIAEIK
jgi:uncharacterized protein YjiS (DUF1127 family)